MKHNKAFLLAALTALTTSFLVGCNNKNEDSSQTQSSEQQKSSEQSSSIQSSSSVSSSSTTIESVSSIEEPAGPLEIGDIVKTWQSTYDYEELPMSVDNGTGECTIASDFGRNDKCSLLCEAKVGSNNQGSISSDAVEEPYFLEEDAKNGDLISLYVYVPEGGNISSIQLLVYPSSKSNPVEGRVINITDENLETWISTSVTFDSLETLGAISVAYKAINESNDVNFYVDDIQIVLEEESVETGYEYNDESLYQTYEDYFKVGTCMSADMLRNTKLRQIAKDNFNSITAENEAKPERILDQKACQELAKNDNTKVAITTAPFEKIYDWCAANNIGVRHHTFVWYSQTPGWFFKTDYTNNGPDASKEIMLARMENFIQVTLDTINERWPELVYAIDVSNEAVDQYQEDHIRASNNKWYDTVGDDFVYYSFLYADRYKADWQKLYYNDFAYDYNVNKCRFALNTLLKKAIDENLIDGVGIQGHIDSNANLDNIMNDAKLIYEKGLECQITELDITVNNTDEQNLNSQKAECKNLVKRVLDSNQKDETDINAVILWGITDDNSWKRNQYPLLFTSDYAKKPCYYGFLEAIEEME